MTSRLVAGLLAVASAAGIVVGMSLVGGWPSSLVAVVSTMIVLLLPAVGWLLAFRRPEIRYGWVLLAAGLSLGAGTLGVGLTASGAPAGLFTYVSTVGYALFYGLTWIFVPLLFPDGRLPSRRWRAVPWISGIAIAVHGIGTALAGVDPSRPAMTSLPADRLVAAAAGGFGQFVTWVIAGVVFCSLVLRWRRSEPPERAQYACMVAGVAATAAGGVLTLLFLLGLSTPTLTAIAGLALVGSLPAAIGVAIVRHRLLDIRFGIRGSRLHLVFDVRPTVGEVLSDLGTALEDTPEPVEQLGRLAAAVRAGLELRWAAVTLADGTRVVAGRAEGPAALTMPVRGGLGHIECGPRDAGPLTGQDRRLLEALAVPAGLAIQSAGLVTRLVNAQEAERRRIERNIHDGVQQQLVALIAGIELARATGAGADMLAHLREQARQTLADLRELAAGIHPSSLSQGGLVEAVEERCSRLPVRTTVTSSPDLRSRRFTDEIEGAMYFTVSEAVANALKHAKAATIDVRLSRAGGRLTAAVADDGKGFDAALTRRRGLATLSDRLDALGGGLTVGSEPGKGTRVNAWVPVDE
ncbi:sensor histidine kinase [Nonomuraea sp. B5E05]|uniref:sensor histidine kinase n=1 Tax=Nonomuraea sp. B5E05 TaxID=3153569 RepID=UPI003261D0EF